MLLIKHVFIVVVAKDGHALVDNSSVLAGVWGESLK
jgi:hypothetical protein